MKNYSEWLNEAKIYAVGSYVKVTGQLFWDQKMQFKIRNKWCDVEYDDNPNASHLRKTINGMLIGKKFVEDNKNTPFFYLKIEKSGSKWIEGKTIFFNGGFTTNSPYARIDIKNVRLKPSGPELAYLLKSETALTILSKIGGEDRMLMGSENFIFNTEGNRADKFTPGRYEFKSVDFNATAKEKKTFIRIIPYRAKGADLLISLDDFLKLKSDDLSELNSNVLAKELSKRIGAKIEIDDDFNFTIPWFSVVTKNNPDNEDLDYQAKPFFSRDQAERHIETIKKQAESEKFPFDTSALEIVESDDHQSFHLDLGQLLEYAKTMGIEISDLDKFFHEHRGAVASKRFGF